MDLQVLEMNRRKEANPLSIYRGPSGFSSRRSHLDSATYRTLLRIFSLCLDEQVSAPNPNPSSALNHLESIHDSSPNPSLNFDADGNSKAGGELGHCYLSENSQNLAQQSDSIHDPNPNPSLNFDSNASTKWGDELEHCQIEKGGALVENSSRMDEELGDRVGKYEEILCADGGTEKGEALTNSGLQVFDVVEGLELEDECADMELLGNMMADCAKLIVGEKDVLLEQIGFDNQPDLEESNKCLDGNVEKHIDLGAPITIEEMSETSREGEVDGDNFEEGEIPNDFEDSNQHLNLVDEPEDNKSGEILVSKSFHKSGGNPDCTNLLDVHGRTKEDYLRTDFSSTLICASNQRLNAFGDDGYLKPEEMKICSPSAGGDVECTSAGPDTLRFLGENLKSSTNMDKERSSKTEVVEIQVNKKRGPPTEERKAKKKRAKKRKRAQKEREQGVNRLKLQPIVKPKEVKYCNFYLVGRCQQGELCKFSHDMTPLTKSQPCKYFACDSCLKGDDCQFDHQLSKYPCHNYMSKGMCIRGDSCKFSHKLPVTEGSSPTSVTSKADSLLPTKKSNFVKQHPMNRTTTSCSQSVTHKPSTENLVSAPKFPKQIPNGIRFLSFGKGPSVDANKQKNGQQRDVNAKSLVQRSVHAAECEKNTMRSGTSACSAATTCNATKKSKVDDSYRSLQTEASEASKILEEFLFCGTN